MHNRLTFEITSFVSLCLAVGLYTMVRGCGLRNHKFYLDSRYSVVIIQFYQVSALLY